MNVVVTGSSGLVGSSVVRACLDRGYHVIGMDNDMRAEFFGNKASTAGMTAQLQSYAATSSGEFVDMNVDIRDLGSVYRVIAAAGRTSSLLVVHCAAQPSHDWAATNPHLDFEVNAKGTLNVLEAVRTHAPNAVVVHVSTNKVYGDRPNMLRYVERPTRYEPDGAEAGWDIPGVDDPWDGFAEELPVDHTTHSLFGASKLAADVYAQEYGRYFGMNVGIFRGGCLTGAAHAGAEQHGFLSYLIKTAVHRQPYTIYGHKGKQVRDNIHADDLARAFLAYADDPDPGAVYNIGGGRENSVSVLEAIEAVSDYGYRHSDVLYGPERIGDHRWWITDTSKFEDRYPSWTRQWSLTSIIDEMVRVEERR